MKILNSILLIAIILVSSGCVDESKPHITIPDSSGQTAKVNYDIITIDNCEYIFFTIGSTIKCFSHKGDCKNPIHIYNIEKETQLDVKEIQITNRVDALSKTNLPNKTANKMIITSGNNGAIIIDIQ